MSLTDFTFPCLSLGTVASESHITASCGSCPLAADQSRYSGKVRRLGSELM